MKKKGHAIKIIKSFCRGSRGTVFSKRGSATPTHSRSARRRSCGASPQKFAEKTKFHKVLIKRVPLAAGGNVFSWRAKSKIIAIVIFVLIAPCAFTRDITKKDLQDKGVLLQSIGNEELLCVINTEDETGAHWFILKDMGRSREIGFNLSCLHLVDHILPSTDNKYLAVLSVGEGHPIVEVIDLEKFRLQSKYVVLQEIDPYPGTVSIDRWDGSYLIVNSNMPLTLRKEDGRVDPDHLLPKDETFSLDVATGEIKSITFDKK
jgi:hypothetical protein